MANLGRQGFRLFNRLFMVPMFRLGFGPFVGNFVTGYIMVLKTVGRKTGKVYFTPVNYAIHKGNVFCIAGWGQESDWYRNIRAKREIEVILPSGPLYGVVEEITNLDERKIVFRKILKNAGFAGFFVGFNPFTATDEILLRNTSDLPLLRIRPVGIENGVFDPGGLSWVWMLVFAALITISVIAMAR